MKRLALLLLLLSQMANADLRLNCPQLTPNDLMFFKPAPTVDPCVNQGTSLVVLTRTGVLYTCENNQMIQRYDISMGRGGIGKTQQGDLKTPIGTYTLGAPRSSVPFGIFIPVGYPTSAQRGQGFTGDDVGIHGPARSFACLGALNAAVNWTTGCMAVADDQFIVEIADFVRSHQPMVVRILE